MPTKLSQALNAREQAGTLLRDSSCVFDRNAPRRQARRVFCCVDEPRAHGDEYRNDEGHRGVLSERRVLVITNPINEHC